MFFFIHMNIERYMMKATLLNITCIEVYITQPHQFSVENSRNLMTRWKYNLTKTLYNWINALFHSFIVDVMEKHFSDIPQNLLCFFLLFICFFYTFIKKILSSALLTLLTLKNEKTTVKYLRLVFFFASQYLFNEMENFRASL